MSLRSPLEGIAAIDGPAGLRLSDLSLACREGVRGAGAREWLLSQGHSLPDAPNQIVANGESGVGDVTESPRVLAVTTG